MKNKEDSLLNKNEIKEPITHNSKQHHKEQSNDNKNTVKSIQRQNALSPEEIKINSSINDNPQRIKWMESIDEKEENVDKDSILSDQCPSNNSELNQDQLIKSTYQGLLIIQKDNTEMNKEKNLEIDQANFRNISMPISIITPFVLNQKDSKNDQLEEEHNYKDNVSYLRINSFSSCSIPVINKESIKSLNSEIIYKDNKLMDGDSSQKYISFFTPVDSLDIDIVVKNRIYKNYNLLDIDKKTSNKRLTSHLDLNSVKYDYMFTSNYNCCSYSTMYPIFSERKKDSLYFNKLPFIIRPRITDEKIRIDTNDKQIYHYLYTSFSNLYLTMEYKNKTYYYDLNELKHKIHEGYNKRIKVVNETEEEKQKIDLYINKTINILLECKIIFELSTDQIKHIENDYFAHIGDLGDYSSIPNLCCLFYYQFLKLYENPFFNMEMFLGYIPIEYINYVKNILRIPLRIHNYMDFFFAERNLGLFQLDNGKNRDKTTLYNDCIYTKVTKKDFAERDRIVAILGGFGQIYCSCLYNKTKDKIFH